MNSVEIFNETNEKIDETIQIEKIIKHALEKEKLENVEFSIILVDNDKIKQINKEYRNIDKETDVISFALEDEEWGFIPEKRVLGDIYISIDKAKEQAKDYSHSLKRELCFLSIHGLLHLLGFDHMNEEDEKIMFAKQKEILDSYGISR
jgi:metalloprotein, YbeY/UPF0054 family